MLAFAIALLQVLAPPRADAATLVGHVVDSHGNLLVTGWEAVLQRGRGVRAAIDPGTGVFSFEGLAPGAVSLRAERGVLAATAVTTVTLQPGQTHEVELLYTGADPDRLVVVRFRTAHYNAVRPADGAVSIVSPGGQRQALTCAGAFWRAEAPAAGRLRLEVDDPRFLPLALDDLVPGRVTQVTLTGSAVLEVEVADAETGRPVPGVTLDFVRYADEVVGRDVGHSLPSAPFGPVRRFGDLVPGSGTVVAEAAGAQRAHTSVSLDPGDVSRIKLLLGPAVAVAGRVVDTRGEPLGGIELECTLLHDTAGARSAALPRLAPAPTVSAPDGTFVLKDLSRGQYTLRASAGPHAGLELALDTEAPGGDTLVVTLPELAPLDLSVRSAVAPRAGRLVVARVLTAQERAHPEAFAWQRRLRHEVGPAGRAEPVLLPLGEHTFAVEVQYGSEAEGWWRGVHVEHLTFQHTGAPVELDVTDLLPGHLGVTLVGFDERWQHVSFTLENADSQRVIGGHAVPAPQGAQQGGAQQRHFEFEGRGGAYTLVARHMGAQWSPERTFEVVTNEVRAARVVLPAEPPR